MKMTVSGVQRIAGTAKATGAAFDMCQLLALVPIETSNGGKVQVNGAGLRAMELPLDPAALPQFMSLKFPCTIELLTEPRPQRGKLETVVTGIAAGAAKF